MFKYTKRSCVVLLALTCFVSPLFLSNAYATEGERTDIFSTEADAYVRYIPSRSANAQSGSVEIIQTEAEYSYILKLFDKLPVQLSLNPGYVSLNNSTSVKLPSRLTKVSGAIEMNLPFFNVNNTFFRLELIPGFFGDNWNFGSGNFRLINRYAVVYKLNDRCFLVGGVAVYPRYENPVWPIFGIVYKPNDRLSFNLIPDTPNITYILNERVSLFLEGSNGFDEYYVNRNGTKTILQYSQTNIGTGATLKINKFLNTSLVVGTVFNQMFKYRDSGGKVGLEGCGFYTELKVQAVM